MNDDDLSLTHAKKVFDNYGLSYDIKLGGSMMWVQSKSGKVYGYYPTSHRWAPRHLRGKHYRAKSTEDFVERFVLKGDERAAAYRDFTKRSYEVHKDANLGDLVSYIWECFDSGMSEYATSQDVGLLVWNHVVSSEKELYNDY
tara:strand:+ start:75 stop:503 length:429 start_codon:yes stop_codon:yes gene_type:complete